MNNIYFAGALALLSSVAACSEQPNAAREETAVPAEGTGAAPTTAPTDVVYTASGQITAVTDETVTISHGPVPDLQWPAMTMAFQAPSPDMLAGVTAGDQVSFAFRQADGGYVLTSLTRN